MCRYFKKIGNADYISSWKSKGLSDAIIKATTSNSHPSSLSYVLFSVTKIKKLVFCGVEDLPVLTPTKNRAFLAILRTTPYHISTNLR